MMCVAMTPTLNEKDDPVVSVRLHYAYFVS